MPAPPVVLLLIDGLRADALAEGIYSSELPHLSRLFSKEQGNGWLSATIAPAPSITFASQASLVTGAHPKQHDVPGNEFFDRFGVHKHGKPHYFAMDIGDTFDVADTLEVFTNGLATRCLGARTLYERAAARGATSAVIGHMYANGADRWIPPSVDMLVRLTKAPAPLKITPHDFDAHIIELAVEDIKKNGLPDIFTVYLLGMDAYSHTEGTSHQVNYLKQIDPLIGELEEAVKAAKPRGKHVFWMLAADHGQRDVPADSEHAIRLQDVEPIFSSLGMDLSDHFGEGDDSDAIFAMNGGMAFVYLRRHHGRRWAPWSEPPDFRKQVLPLAHRFWEAHLHGKHSPMLEGAVHSVLVRPVEAEGWHSDYFALTPKGKLVSLEDWFARVHPSTHVDGLNRIRNMTSPLAGDILVITEPRTQKYFGHPVAGLHGGLSPECSYGALAIGWPGVDRKAFERARNVFVEAMAVRCHMEGGRLPQVADAAVGLEAVLTD